jgi:cytochrome b6-f complex iron-sulfur subunit
MADDVEAAGEDLANRRTFLARVLSGTLAAGAFGLAASIAAYLAPSARIRGALGPRRVKVAAGNDIPAGAGRLTLVEDEPVWVVNLGSELVAASAVCTHKGCTVRWEEKRRLFRCPCHDGRFDDRGNVVAGPPRRPLARFEVALIDGDVYVVPSNGPRT